MSALVVLFNLKNEAAKDAYEHWAKTTDVPTVKNLSSVNDFRVYRMGNLMGTEEKGPYQYCEIIDVNDMEKLGAEVGTEIMQKVAAEFQEFADNPIFIVSEQFA